MVKLKYNDIRKIEFPRLTKYPNGIGFPNKTNILEATEGEAKTLLKLKNGKINVWEIIKEKEIKKEYIKEEEIKEIKEKIDKKFKEELK